jgi:hypothetical protein
MFPELKESEGEKIRKEIISALKYANYKGVYDKHIAWLEKQYADPIKEYWRGYNEGKQNVLDKYAELKKQSEQKPKFRVGDTIKCKYDDRQFTVKSVDLEKGTYAYTKKGCGNDIDYADEAFELAEQKPAEWSNKDSLMLNCTISALQSEADRKDGYIDKDTLKDLEKWLKSLKDRVQPQPKQEYDDMAYEMTRAVLYDKLKDSLRPQNRWKPSEEQMKTLNEVINYCANGKEAYLNDYIYNRLIDLRDELNKL